MAELVTVLDKKKQLHQLFSIRNWFIYWTAHIFFYRLLFESIFQNNLYRKKDWINEIIYHFLE